jgi:dCMP deaminase
MNVEFVGKVQPRISKDQLYLQIAELIATRGTCARRQVGCVLVDKHGRILSTGYNGVASGQPHCSDPAHRCSGARSPSGTDLALCQAIHAEQNAILYLSDPFSVDTAYLTDTPCESCIKLLLGTSCRRIVANRKYPHPEAINLWLNTGRELWIVDGSELSRQFPA